MREGREGVSEGGGEGGRERWEGVRGGGKVAEMGGSGGDKAGRKKLHHKWGHT